MLQHQCSCGQWEAAFDLCRSFCSLCLLVLEPSGNCWRYSSGGVGGSPLFSGEPGQAIPLCTSLKCLSEVLSVLYYVPPWKTCLNVLRTVTTLHLWQPMQLYRMKHCKLHNSYFDCGQIWTRVSKFLLREHATLYKEEIQTDSLNLVDRTLMTVFLPCLYTILFICSTTHNHSQTLLQ